MSYVFALLIITGYINIICKQRLGFIAQFIGCMGMIGLYSGQDGGIVLVNSVFAVINIWGFFKWKKE